MKTKLYLLRIKPHIDEVALFGWDRMDGIVVEAKSPKSARNIAYLHHIDEGDVWLNADMVSCKELKLLGEERAIIRDCSNG
jgi:hypothetical protein